jgi:hypothetical protein
MNLDNTPKEIQDWHDIFWEEIGKDYSYPDHIPEIYDTYEYLRDKVIYPIQAELKEKEAEIAKLKKFVVDDLQLAIKVLNRLLTHCKLDLGAEAAKKMLHEIDELNNKGLPSQETKL